MVANGGGFETLLVWQRAHELVRAVYRLSSTFPKFELYALGDQMRRSSVSIAANIAEAYSRRSPKDKLRFLNMSRGSLEETRYFLRLCRDLGYGDGRDENALLEESSKLLRLYEESIRKRAEVQVVRGTSS